jgi:molybdate transport system substrate-binding protein
VTTFGASGQLAQQIKAGAPFDLFLSANRAFARDLADAGFLDPETVRPYAVGTLVLVVARDPSTPVAGLGDLTRPEVKKVAIANPKTAPYGAAAKQALEKSGLWDKLQDRLVIADSVRQALQYVQTGNAEAGLVGRSISGVPEVKAIEVDSALYEPIEQNLGVIKASTKAELAAALAKFVTDPGGQDVFAKHGFKPPSAARP